MDLRSFREDFLKYNTPSAFAEMLGVPESDVLKWEQNSDSISLTAIQKIIEKTGVSYEMLTGWKKPVAEPLKVEDTWKEADFTKKTLSEYVSSVLLDANIPDEYKKDYIEDLRDIIDANLKKPTVAIVGRSDTGKSTLINQLLGSEKMPTSWTPTTSIAVYIKHISDKPDYIKEDVWVFANQVGKENAWDESKLNDESYCQAWKIAAGDIEILRSFGTRQGENYDKEAGSAVVFIDSPVLENCDIIDLPGFGTETEKDDTITHTRSKKADVLCYLSQANGFMRIEDITYLKDNIKALPIWEKKGKNSLKPLANLFVIASQAHTVNQGNREDLKNILDTGCENLLKVVTDNYWSDREKLSGYTYENHGYSKLRSRFFAYTTNIPDICKPFNDAFKEVLELLPGVIDKNTKTLVKSYVEKRTPNLIDKIHEYEDIVTDRNKYLSLLDEIKKNELPRKQENDKRKKEVKDEIVRLSSESINEFSEYMAKTINTDAIVRLIKERKVKNKKKDIEQFGSFLQSTVQERCETILKEKSAIFSEKTQGYINAYTESISHAFENNKIEVGFDAGWAFASALSKPGMIGGFGTCLASAVSNTLFFAGLGVSLGSSILVGIVTSPILGPIGIAAELLMAGGGLGLVKLFGGGWEKSVAKEIVFTFDKNNLSEKFRDGIREYWRQTEETFDKASIELEKDWDNYVCTLQKMVDEYDIQEVQHKIAVLNYLVSDFFKRILL